MSVLDRYPAGSIDRLDSPRLKAAVAGVTTVLLLIVIGLYVGENAATADTVDPYKQVIGVLFIGMATGYFLGRAVEGDDTPSTSYLVGFFGATALASFYLARASLLTPIMGLSMITIFLMYDSNMIEKNGPIDDFIVLLIEIMAGVLGFIAVVHYLSPTLTETLGPILEQIPEQVVVGVTLTVLFAVAAVALWKVVPIARNMIARLNDHLVRIRGRYEE